MMESWTPLESRPFAVAPQAHHYFPAEAIEQARRAVHRAIERGLGPSLVLGHPGGGKSLLALVLQQSFRAQAPFALISGSEVQSRQELLQSVLYALGLPYRGLSEAELRLTLLDFLTSRDASVWGTVLVIDDADYLSQALLLDLASLSSHTRDGNWCLHLVLLGSPKLEELLGAPALRSLQQRIATRCVLRAWTRRDTELFLQRHEARFARPHQAAQWFPAAVVSKVQELTGGIPRLINQLCEHALLLASVRGQSGLDPATLEEAWHDLQQLPPPRANTSQIPTSGIVSAEASAPQDTIEFGALDDEADLSQQLEDIEQQLATLSSVATPASNIAAAHADAQTATPPIESWTAPVSRSATEFTSRTTAMDERCNNPFLETFEREEIVWESPHSLDTPLVHRHPAVRTLDGSLLAETLVTIEARRLESPPAFDAVRDPESFERAPDGAGVPCVPSEATDLSYVGASSLGDPPCGVDSVVFNSLEPDLEQAFWNSNWAAHRDEATPLKHIERVTMPLRYEPMPTSPGESGSSPETSPSIPPRAEETRRFRRLFSRMAKGA